MYKLWNIIDCYWMLFVLYPLPLPFNPGPSPSMCSSINFLFILCLYVSYIFNILVIALIRVLSMCNRQRLIVLFTVPFHGALWKGLLVCQQRKCHLGEEDQNWQSQRANDGQGLMFSLSLQFRSVTKCRVTVIFPYSGYGAFHSAVLLPSWRYELCLYSGHVMDIK